MGYFQLQTHPALNMLLLTLSKIWTPLLAAPDASKIISVLFVLFAFASWIWNVISSQQQQPAQPQRRPPPQPGRQPAEKELQAEINRFLRQVTGQQQPAEDELEVIEESDDEPVAAPPRRSKSAKRQKPRSEQRTRSTEGPQGNNRPGGKIAQRRGPGSKDLGSSVREHLAEHMQDRVAKQAEQHFTHGVAEQVERDLGSFTAGIQAAGIGSAEKKPDVSTATSVVAMLRNPATVRQAFVMNLILNRHERRRKPRA